jgi:thiosulfate dehydrogenase [quinone] large subunit
MTLSAFQQAALVVLRTLIGWHFAYEGWFKLVRPAWGPEGPLAPWTSAGYLRGAGGPFARLFHAMAESAWLPWIDLVVAAALLVAGLTLMFGLFTDAGAVVGLALLALFYVSLPPTSGMPHPGAEGAYLFVNKNVVEAAGLVVLLSFDTGRIAGLDVLRRRRRAPTARLEERAA